MLILCSCLHDEDDDDDDDDVVVFSGAETQTCLWLCLFSQKKMRAIDRQTGIRRFYKASFSA